MMNMKLLVVLTPLSIYHGWSNWKTLWEEKFTGEENFTLDEFIAVNMKNCGHCNVSKHRKIKGSDKHVPLEILLKFDSLYKMKITPSDSKDNLGRSGKGLITSLGIKAKARQKNAKRQGIPSVMSVRRTFQRLLGILKNYLIKVMRRRGPNISLLIVTFNCGGLRRLHSVVFQEATNHIIYRGL